MTALIKKFILPLVIIIMLVSVNGALYHNSLSGGEIIQSRDIYGRYYSTGIRSLNNRERLIYSLCGDYKKDMETLSLKIERLTLYEQTAEYILNDNYTAILSLNDLQPEERREKAEQIYSEIKASFPVSDDKLIDRIKEEMNDYNSVIDYLRYLDEYKDYVTDISEQSDLLADISIYSGNGSAMSNIIKTKKDFYGLANIPLTPAVEDSFIAFLNFRASDLLAVFAAFLGAAMPLFIKKSSVAASVIFTFFGTAAMYLCNFVITDIMLELPSPDVSLQSMESFSSCPYMINTGMLTAGVILFKALGASVLTLILTIIISVSGRKRIIALITAMLFLAAEILFAASEGFTALLKEINILSFFSFERFFLRYLNLDIFGASVSRLPIFLISAIIFVSTLLIISVKNVRKQNLLLVKEAEQHYYDEINRRYQESRKIRHDIQNHLLALNMLIESGNIDSARKYINEVSEQTDLAAMPVKTGSEVLDALLFKKTEQAREKQISLLFEVSCSLKESGISDYDLCTVFGNVIDNAIEAANEKDTVTVKLDNQHDMLYISCENPLRKPLKKRGDKILTTKPNPLSHGYGIARVKEIAERYDGAVQITDEDGKFLIEILINPKK